MTFDSAIIGRIASLRPAALVSTVPSQRAFAAPSAGSQSCIWVGTCVELERSSAWTAKHKSCITTLLWLLDRDRAGWKTRNCYAWGRAGDLGRFETSRYAACWCRQVIWWKWPLGWEAQWQTKHGKVVYRGKSKVAAICEVGKQYRRLLCCPAVALWN